jgi:hypothetical protein
MRHSNARISPSLQVIEGGAKWSKITTPGRDCERDGGWRLLAGGVRAPAGTRTGRRGSEVEGGG